jgi:hypothetical protein
MSSSTVNITESAFDNNKCHNEITLETMEACPLNLYQIWAFFNNYKMFFGTFLIIVGIFLAFFGTKLLAITVFIIITAIVTTLIFIIMFQLIIPKNNSNVIIWVVLGISLVIGIVLGWLVNKYKQTLFGITLGSYMGYLLGILLLNVGLNRIELNPTVVYWVTIVICIIIGALLAYFLFKHIVIFSTSFIGGYTLIKGVNLYLKGLPDEGYIMDIIKNGETELLKEVLTPVVYGYLAGWLVTFILGVIVQYRINRENKDEDKLDDNYRFYSGKGN